MIKKLLVGLAVLSCTISPQSNFAAENGTAAIYHLGSQAAGNETALSQSGNGLAPIGVKQADEEMEQRYAKREDNQISPQSYVSEYQIYSEIERRVKDAMLSGQTTVDISDMNIYETKCVFPYYYGYSPYFPEGSFVALYYAEDGLYVEADIQNPLSIEETKAYFAQVDAKLAFYQSLVNDSMTQEQKALTIHDYIVSHSEYDTSYSIYACEGIFMRGIGVCQSYACTYMYILNSLGIDCYFVPSDEMWHGWNIVRINGQLYHVDCTYDDPVSDRFGMASHEYFLLSDNAISQMDHYSWNAQGMTCISNAYESAFWRNSESPIVLAGGNSYYMDSDWTTLIERNNSTGAETILTNTSTNDTGVYSGQQDTGLFYYDGGICYNSSNQILEFDLSDRTEYVLYDLEDSVGAIINGCREENGAITFVADWSPYYSTGDIYEIVWNDGWYETDDGWVYIVKGKPLKGWRELGQNWYYFDSNGIMLKNTWVTGRYYVKEDGTMARSEWVENGKYYVDENGIWDSSKIAKWQISNGRWWYQHADGSYTTNDWENIDGEWYYFDALGYMLSSTWVDGRYYVKDNGKMAHSEWVENGKYYVDENGVWDSSKVAKWQISNGRWWYSHADGSYTTNGWENIDGDWYYFDESGYMASACWIGVYYVKENGKMAHSEWVDNGRYYVDENGVWVQGTAVY